MINIGTTQGHRFELPYEAATQKFAILAVSGAGKTYAGSVMAEEMLESGQQIVVVDPLGVWNGLRSSADGKKEGFSIIIVGGEHQDVPLEVASGKVLANFVIDSGHSVILDLSQLRTKADEIRFAYEFMEELYRRKNRDVSPLHIFLDEADLFAPQKPGPDQTKLLGSLENIVRRGRAKGLGITLITQRSAVLNKNVLTQIETLIVMRTIAPQDRHAIEEWISYYGTADDRRTIMSSLASLSTGEAWVYSPAWLRTCSLVKIRKRKTFDSSSTPKVGDKPAGPQRKAEVDLDILRGELSATIERAKENDPVELKKRIDALQKQVRQLESAQPTIDQAVIDEAVSNAVHEAIENEREKHAQYFRDRLHANLRELLTNSTRFQEKHAELLNEIDNHLEEESARLIDVPKLNNTHKQEVRRQKLTPVSSAVRAPSMVASNGHVLANARKTVSSGDFSISKAQQRILDALAWYESIGNNAPSNIQVGAVASMDTTGGYFSNTVGPLSTNGLIVRAHGVLSLTEKGRQIAKIPDAISTLDDYHDALRQRVLRVKTASNKTVKILNAIIDKGGDSLTTEEIGHIVGIDHTGGYFSNMIGPLGTLGLITRERGIVTPTNVLFPEL